MSTAMQSNLELECGHWLKGGMNMLDANHHNYHQCRLGWEAKDFSLLLSTSVAKLVFFFRIMIV